ncbi:MAG: peptidoglycan-binding protein [Acidimicrobiia bacterium]
MDGNALNWRGVAVFGLAVLTVIVLIAVIDDEPAHLGVNTVGSSNTTITTLPGLTTTTVAGGTTTTTKAGTTATTKAGTGTTTTTKPTTATTLFNPAGKPQLQLGSTGPDVTLVQQTLKNLGIYTGTVDGSYGAGTQAAVVKFQTGKNITPADGVVGPATWTALSTG